MSNVANTNWPDINNGSGDSLEGATTVGDSLVFETASGGTISIPLVGPNGTIDFNNLSPTQSQALKDHFKGDLLCDLSGNPSGFLVSI